MMEAPTQEPAVPDSITPITDSSPRVWARYAAGGMMVSLGMGTSVLSSAMSPAMSQYPPCERTDRYQSDNSCSSADTEDQSSACGFKITFESARAAPA